MASESSSSGLKLKMIAIGVVLFVLFVSLVDLSPGNPGVTYTAGIGILMAFWWVSEAIPIGATSLIPLVLFPAFGVLNGKDVSNAYINYVIFLFLGGFLMALALEKVELHKRIALKILSKLGGSPFKILLGFMLASAFLSMWMSNTATAMMMLPIALSVIKTLETVHGGKVLGKYTTAIMLGIAYACSIGGVVTLVGTPPNLSLVRIFEIIYPKGPEISFGQWMIFAFPIALVMFVVALLVNYFVFPPSPEMTIKNKSFFKDKFKELGPITVDQKRVLILFILLTVMWVFRKTLHIGDFTLPGWSSIFGEPKFINDGTVAIFVGLLLFIVPSSRKGEGLITWETTRNIPWGIILLFGGGFALAKGVIDSGLSNYIGEQLSGAAGMGQTGLLFSVTGLMTFLTEFTSNTATTEMMLPVVASLTKELHMNPLFLMVPLTLAASMAFMFPVATPPNAVVFGSGKVKMGEMMKAGIIINIIAIVSIVALMYFWGTVVFDIDINTLPEWANGVETQVSH